MAQTSLTQQILFHLVSARFLGPPGPFGMDWVPLGAISTAASGLGRSCQRQFSAPLLWFRFVALRKKKKKNMFGSQSALSLGRHRAKEVIHVDKHHPGCFVPPVTPIVVNLWQACQTPGTQPASCTPSAMPPQENLKPSLPSSCFSFSREPVTDSITALAW